MALNVEDSLYPGVGAGMGLGRVASARPEDNQISLVLCPSVGWPGICLKRGGGTFFQLPVKMEA